MADNFFKVSKGVNLTPQSGTPSNPLAGDQYYDSVRNTLAQYINGNWTDVQSRSDVASASSLTSTQFTSTVMRSNIVKLTGSTSGSVHGMASASDAKYMVLYNGTSVLQTLKHNSATETTAGNRIATSTGADAALPAGQSALFFYDSTQSRWILVSVSGSGGGTGAKNYLGTVNNSNGNGDFELGSTAGWSLFNTTLTSGIPTGSISAGAASVTTFDVINSGQLAGTYSLRTASSAAWSAGQGFISDARTIDKEDQAKVMTFKAYYQCFANPSNGNFSGTSSNTFAVYIYDVANSAWIQPAGVYGITQNAGVGYVTGTFQTASNATSYRLAVVAVNASSGAITMYWDDFSLSPQTAPYGTAIGDWKTFSMVITGTGSNPSRPGSGIIDDRAAWRRVGDSMELYFTYHHNGAAGTAGSGTYLFNLPSGYTIDTSKFTVGADTNPRNSVGFAACDSGGGGNTGFVKAYSTTQLVMVVPANGSSVATGVGSTNYSMGASPVAYTFTAIVPIVGWGSTVQMSNDTDTRIVVAQASQSSTAVGANALVPFSGSAYDSHGAITLGTGRFTAPISGYYKVSVAATKSTAGNSLNIAFNGSPAITLFSFAVASGWTSGSAIVKMNAGDYVDLRPDGAMTLGLVAYFERISGPSVIAASETVAVSAYDVSGATLTSGLSTVAYATKIKDTHGSFSGGVFTAPVSGLYQVNAVVYTNSVALSTGNYVSLQVYKNGSTRTFSTQTNGTGGTLNWSTSVSGLIPLLAGETIQVQAQLGSGSVALITSAYLNSFSIVKVGN